MVLIRCVNCGVEKKKRPSDVKNINRQFCSRSCAATVNSRDFPRRKKSKKCKACGSLIQSRQTYCDSCKPNNIDRTLEEIMDTQNHRSSAFAIVRQRARSLARKFGWNACARCGYSLHVEVAHKTPITDFPLSTKLSVVNDPSNLIPLCPNCHWEFDNMPRV